MVKTLVFKTVRLIHEKKCTRLLTVKKYVYTKKFSQNKRVSL